MNVAALEGAVRLKAVRRAGWLRIGIAAPEHVADHSWGVAWLVLVLLPEPLDRGKALTYAILHDLAEAWVGDITPHDGVPPSDKRAMEEAALRRHFESLGQRGQELLSTWLRYEEGADPEARFVRELDRLDMAVQAAAYRRQGYEVDAFFASADAAIQTPALRSLLAQLRTSP